MNKFMIKPRLISLAVSATLLFTGCGDAQTTINQKASIPIDDDHTPSGQTGTDTGRLLMINTVTTQAQVYDIHEGELLATIPLDALPSAVYATAGHRYAALIERNADKVGFIDGGLWQEPHDDHFDVFTATPTLSNFSLSGARPTHFVPHDGQVAVFLDGDGATGANAGVQVFDDHTIEDAAMPLTVGFSMPQHGVAEPRGTHLLASIRRDDAQSTFGECHFTGSSRRLSPSQRGL